MKQYIILYHEGEPLIFYDKVEVAELVKGEEGGLKHEVEAVIMYDDIVARVITGEIENIVEGIYYDNVNAARRW